MSGAVSRRRLLAAGLLLVLLGLLLALLGSSLWVTTAGLLLGAVGAAALISSFGYGKLAEPVDRRLALAALLTLALAPAAIYLGLERPAVEVQLSAIEPTPGAPITLSGLVHEGHRAAGKAAPIWAAFGSFAVSQGEPPGQSDERPASAKLLLELPLRPRDCKALEAGLGGGCGGKPMPPVGGPSTLTIETLAAAHPLGAEVWPEGSEALELIEPMDPSQQRVPSEWVLAPNGGRTEVRFACSPGTPVLVARPRFESRAHCGTPGSYYELEVAPDPGLLTFLTLSQLSEFKLALDGQRLEGTVGAGKMVVSGQHSELPPGPTEIAVRGAGGDRVGTEIDQVSRTSRNTISVGSDQAGHLYVNQADQVPTWSQQHSEILYFLLGVLAAVLVPALFDFAAEKLGK